MGESERLGLIINHLKTNAFQFSKRAKIAQGSVSNILNGRRRMSRDIIDQIIKTYPEINMEWILRGVGTMFHDLPKEADQLNEDAVAYTAIKSTVSLQHDGLPDEEAMKSNVSDNLKTAGKRWKLTQPELLELLGGNVSRQGVNTYFRGDTLPRLPQLLRLERLVGWPLVELVSRSLEFDEIPAAPLVAAPLFRVQLSAAQIEEMRDEMHRMQLRIARFIKKIEQNAEGK